MLFLLPICVCNLLFCKSGMWVFLFDSCLLQKFATECYAVHKLQFLSPPNVIDVRKKEELNGIFEFFPLLLRIYREWSKCVQDMSLKASVLFSTRCSGRDEQVLQNDPDVTSLDLFVSCEWNIFLPPNEGREGLSGPARRVCSRLATRANRDLLLELVSCLHRPSLLQCNHCERSWSWTFAAFCSFLFSLATSCRAVRTVVSAP